MDKDEPLLIVNVKGVEEKMGTSVLNQSEAKVVDELLQYFTNEIQHTKGWNDRPLYKKEKFWCITPYFA